MHDEKRTIRMSIALTPTERIRLGTAAMVMNRKVADYARNAALQQADELLGPRERRAEQKDHAA